MKLAFYPKLAIDGIRKNKRIYFPYILTGTVMVMMYYILIFLADSSTLYQMPGGNVLTELLGFGSMIVAFFSLLFLFYTNSFLIRQRNREFGLYNILGMGKGSICKIILWEGLFIGIITIAAGLILGIILSKFAELSVLNLLKYEVNFELQIGIGALCTTAILYGVIYLLLLIKSIIQVFCSKPIELMQSNKVGEKPPKGNWVLAILGLIFLGVAYFLSVSIQEPMTAISVFFFAVLLVIAGTYLLFIAGSVVYCRLLQKNKTYYYHPKHFVSVSSMVYRMKRNGAGLASICILLTMVLVMISSTASLYYGEEELLHQRYPYGVNVQLMLYDFSSYNETISASRQLVTEHSQNAEIIEYRNGYLYGLLTDTGVIVEPEVLDENGLNNYEKLRVIQVVPLEDYNHITNQNVILNPNECLLYSSEKNRFQDSFTLSDGKTLQVKERLNTFFINEDILPTISLVVDDFEGFMEPYLSMTFPSGQPFAMLDWTCGFDLPNSQDEVTAANNIYIGVRDTFNNMPGGFSYSIASREEKRHDFLSLYGSLFFLGIMLSIVFLMAAVMIIYYKQLSEGYEDQSRFEIMQKVGMTKKEIKKSINSQILTVFFLPLLTAGVHLGFAFPFLWKMLQLFYFQNITIIIVTTLLSFIAFGLFYTLVYKITSNTYYSIVSGAK